MVSAVHRPCLVYCFVFFAVWHFTTLYPRAVYAKNIHSNYKMERHLHLAANPSGHNRRQHIQTRLYTSQLPYNKVSSQGNRGYPSHSTSNQKPFYYPRKPYQLTGQHIQTNSQSPQGQTVHDSVGNGQFYGQSSSSVQTQAFPSQAQPFPIWYEPVTDLTNCVPPSCPMNQGGPKHVSVAPERTEKFSVKDKFFQSIGCWRDTHARAIPPLEGKHRLLMNGMYRNRVNALMKCAEAALDKQLNLFALQDGGMCFGHKNTNISYKVYGSTNTCEGDGEGGVWSNEVYSFLDKKGKPLVQVNGNYGQWSPWSACSTTCSSAGATTPLQMRNRTCASPLPANGGQDCSIFGPGYESRVCQVPSCGAIPTASPASTVPSIGLTPTTKGTTTYKPTGSQTTNATTQPPSIPVRTSPVPTSSVKTGSTAPSTAPPTASPSSPPVSTTSAGRIATKCKVKVNLAFVVDGSGSIEYYGKGNFQKVKKFIKDMVRGFNVAQDGTRVGLVLFSTIAQVVFGFDKHYDQEGVLQEIDNIAYPRGITKTGLGLSLARTDLFEKASRIGVPNMLLVLTDGKSSDSASKPARELRDSGVVIFSIGIGTKFARDELNAMATDPDSDHVFTADFNAMGTLIAKIKGSVCKNAANPVGGIASDVTTVAMANKGLIAPVALFPLNSKYIAREAIHNDTFGFLGDVAPAVGPDNKPGTSLAFLGNANSYIHFPRNARLDTKKSLTLLAWVFPEQAGPIFNYKTNLWGTQLLLFTPTQLVGRITSRDGSSISHALSSTHIQPGEWNFVGLSYNHKSGTAYLWINGEREDVKHVGLMDVATNFPVRMGALDGKRNFKGQIACMQVYDVALNKRQVASAKDACKTYE